MNTFFKIILYPILMLFIPSGYAETTRNMDALDHGQIEESNLTLLEKVDLVRAPADNFIFHIDAIGPEGDEFVLQVRVREQVNSLVRYLAPPKAKGRALLFLGPNMWVYVPGSRRPLRISPQQQALGGVSSADIARVVYNLDYVLESVEEQDAVAGEQRLLLKLKRASRGAAYERIDLEVVGKEARPLRAVHYSLSNRALKTVYFEDYQFVLNRWRPLLLRIVDHLEGDAETVLRYREYAVEETPETWFQPTYLKRLR